jgi:hypothetical protein
MKKEPEINDMYFQRFFVPTIITLLILCGIAVLIATPSGTPAPWSNFSTVFKVKMPGTI